MTAFLNTSLELPLVTWRSPATHPTSFRQSTLGGIPPFLGRLTRKYRVWVTWLVGYGGGGQSLKRRLSVLKVVTDAKGRNLSPVLMNSEKASSPAGSLKCR